jgi:hypothetical protein
MPQHNLSLKETNMELNRKYLIILTNEVNKIDFSQVIESSADTIRLSVDGSKTFIKWEGITPSFVEQFVFKEGPYTHEEILTILSTSEWVHQQPIH